MSIPTGPRTLGGVPDLGALRRPALPPPPGVPVTDPNTGQEYEMPQAAVGLLPDNLVMGIVQLIVGNVMSNVARMLKDRCAFQIGPSTTCGVTRVMHNVPRHDFVEPPPAEQPKAETGEPASADAPSDAAPIEPESEGGTGPSTDGAQA